MRSASLQTRFSSLVRGLRARIMPFNPIPQPLIPQEPAMPVQFIGMIQPNEVSKTIPRRGPAVDPAYVRVFAQAHEHAGFDRIQSLKSHRVSHLHAGSRSP